MFKFERKNSYGCCRLFCYIIFNTYTYKMSTKNLMIKECNQNYLRRNSYCGLVERFSFKKVGYACIYNLL